MRLSREEAGDILQNIIKYASGEPLSQMTAISEFVFEYIRQDIDSCIETYENKVEVAQENGKKGGRPSKHKEKQCSKYGEYQNVILSDKELNKLKEDFSENKVIEKIEALSVYMKKKGKSYDSHYATVRDWINKDLKEGGESNDSQNNSSGDKGKAFNIEDLI